MPLIFPTPIAMSGLVLSIFPGIGLLDRAFEEEGFCVVRGPDLLWGGDIRTFHPPAGKFDGVIGGPPCQVFSSLVHLVRANGHEPRFGNLIPEFERCVREASPAWFVMEEVRGAPVPAVPGYAIKDFLWNNSWVNAGDGFGEEQERLRRFSFGVRGSNAVDLRRWMEPAALMLMEATVSNNDGRRACVVGGQHGAAPPPSQRDKMRRQTVLTSNNPVPVAIGGSGKVKRTRAMFGDVRPTRREHRTATVTSSDGSGRVKQTRYGFADACRLQGLPEDFLDDAPFTAAGKLKAVANGVPIPLGRAIAKAVKSALAAQSQDTTRKET